MVEILTKIVPPPIYIIDEIANDHGHEVVRTPPYHPELQPIEICRGIVKNDMARNCDFTMNNLALQLEKSFSIVTSITCAGIIGKVNKKGDSFWDEDIKDDI